MMAMQIDPREFKLCVSKEVIDLLTATAHPVGMTAGAAFNQAFDGLEQIEPADYDPGTGPLADMQLKLDPAQRVKTLQTSACTGISVQDIAVAAIRQYAERHSS